MFSCVRLKAGLLFLFGVLLSACVTLPGHRFIIDETDYFLHIEAPSKQQRSLIRFNQEQTALTHLPENVWIVFRVTDSQGKHRLRIVNKANVITYQYTINGKQVTFGESQNLWFAQYIPRIIDESGANYGA